MKKTTNSEIIIEEDVEETLKPYPEDISPYDASFPIKFLSDGMKERMDLANRTAKAIYNAVVKESSVIAQTQQAAQKGYRYVVDASESTLKAIESGKIKLTTEKSGQMFAQTRESNGHYGRKLPIKREEFSKGIDTVQMANAMQMKALQNQVEMLADQIKTIDNNVKEVLQGQQNDRIGLYYSGLALFLESQNVNDDQIRKALIAQSLRGLSEATFQLTLTLKADIRYLANKEYKSSKGKRVEQMEKRMQNIHQSFGFIHQATMLRAGIYCEQGEMAAMSTVLGEYSHFIDETIVKNACMLSQCDVSDNGTESGIWKSRANLKLDVSDFTKQIKSPEKTFYLGVETEE